MRKHVLIVIAVLVCLVWACGEREVPAGPEFPINDKELQGWWGGGWYHRSVYSADTVRVRHAASIEFTDSTFTFEIWNLSSKGDMVATFGTGIWEVRDNVIYFTNLSDYTANLMYIPLTGPRPVERLGVGHIMILENATVIGSDTVYRDTFGLSLPE